ncbi:hypothetical protein KIPB_012272, partial [Kipferlia bialata]
SHDVLRADLLDTVGTSTQTVTKRLQAQGVDLATLRTESADLAQNKASKDDLARMVQDMERAIKGVSISAVESAAAGANQIQSTLSIERQKHSDALDALKAEADSMEERVDRERQRDRETEADSMEERVDRLFDELGTKASRSAVQTLTDTLEGKAAVEDMCALLDLKPNTEDVNEALGGVSDQLS